MGLMKDFDIRIRNGGDDAAGAVNELMAELQRRLLELQVSMPRWIPAGERLPDFGDRVLIFCPLLEPDEIVGAAMDKNGLWTCDDGQLLGTDEPTHWMPLPAPPNDAK